MLIILKIKNKKTASIKLNSGRLSLYCILIYAGFLIIPDIITQIIVQFKKGSTITTISIFTSIIFGGSVIALAALCWLIKRSIENTTQKKFKQWFKIHLNRVLSLKMILISATLPILSDLIITSLLSGINDQGSQNTKNIAGLTTINPVLLISVTLILPIVEEIVFRFAIPQIISRQNMKNNWFKNKKPTLRFLGVFISCLIFALMHESQIILIPFCEYFIDAFIFSYLDHYYNSLIPSVISHITNNILAMVLIL